MRKRKWTIEQLTNSLKNATSLRGILVDLGLRPAGGNYAQIRKYILENKLDSRHLKGRGWSKGIKIAFRPKHELHDILVKGSNYQSFKLKRRLFRAGLKPMYCEMCGWNKQTPDGYLPLELDHINGDHSDNRLENLQVLCPNCHSLQPTHRGRKIRHKK